MSFYEEVVASESFSSIKATPKSKLLIEGNSITLFKKICKTENYQDITISENKTTISQSKYYTMKSTSKYFPGIQISAINTSEFYFSNLPDLANSISFDVFNSEGLSIPSMIYLDQNIL